MAAQLYAGIPEELKDSICELGIKNVNLDLEEFLQQHMPRREPTLTKLASDSVMNIDSSNFTPRKVQKPSQRKGVTAKQRQKFNVYKIEKNPGSYKSFMPLHQLWLEYFRHVMSLGSLDCSRGKDLTQSYTKLLKADYHGCIMTVSRSKCPSMVGATGILLQEGKNSMKLLTKEDKLKVIPKANNVFTFEVDGYAFHINGSHFCVKTSQRAVKKFKTKVNFDL